MTQPDDGGVDIVLLAAGLSRRMGGSNKLLATFEGTPLVRRSAQTALAAGCRRVHVVLGHMGAEIGQALAGLDVDLVPNPHFVEGLSSSLRTGFASAQARGARGVLVMLADHPLLRPEHLRALVRAFRDADADRIVVASDKGRYAHPVVFPARLRSEIDRLSGDRGARSILDANRDHLVLVEIGPAASFDVDTPDLVRQAGGEPASIR